MRILILVAIASQTAAFIFSIFGLNCTSIGLQRPDLKYRLVRRKSDKDTFFKCAFRTLFPLFFIWFRLYLFQLAPSCSRSHWWKILINPTNIRYFISNLKTFASDPKSYIDVGDGCWRRFILVTALRCNWFFTSQKSPTSLQPSLADFRHLFPATKISRLHQYLVWRYPIGSFTCNW